MPLLATFVASLFSAALSVFSRFFILEKAAKLAGMTVALSLAGAIIVSMKSCINGTCAASISAMSAAHAGFAMGLAIVFNSTTLAAVGCYMTVWIACQLYVIKKKAINMLMGGN